MNKNAKNQVVQQLKSYPVSSKIVRTDVPDSEVIRQMGRWVCAIDRVMESLKADAPRKAELAQHLFFDEVSQYAADSCARRNEVLELMYISEPTLCRWRDDIINEALISAIEAGAVSVYGALEASI